MSLHRLSIARVLVSALLASSPVLAQSATSTLEERMSQADFAASGLDRLSAEQLSFLNEWLGSKGISAAVAPIKKRDGTMEFYPDEGDRDIVESRIEGEFNGWSGRTTFTLENGQKWQQSESGGRESRLVSPAVKIKPASMGSWLMYVTGCNCSVRVKRVG